MKKHLLNSHVKKVLILVAMLGIVQSVFTYSSGPPAGYTNAPGGSNCTACHNSYSLQTSGTNWNGITLTTTTSLSGLSANTTYPMSLSFASSVSTMYGFEVCVLPSSATSSSASLGTLSITNSTETQLVTSSGPARSYVEHTFAGTSASSNSKTWNFNWHTPSSYTGGATFYVVINEANGNSSSSGDIIYAKTFSSIVLPVKWLDFTVASVENRIQLNWSTAQEINNDYFQIEKSEDGIEFLAIGNLKGKAKEVSKSYYSFNDDMPLAGKTFYRIKQVDLDGKFDYSKILSFDPKQSIDPVITYNQIENEIQINHADEMGSVKIYGLNGQWVQTAISKGSNRFNINKMPDGIYLVEVNGLEKHWFKKLVFQ